ncbi:alpha-mannosidase [Paenibacillus zeisoli]|uniref:Alpha-mannosidase n=1 Tax=Paenibacillus zeisoli TaxID=2496267 RepID=A0A3S1BCR3_9BACL|nr:alpha-mannosidase [Paenibacillus zeisoli]RUT36494.1 alpha-mannosidase [Paenibacillus zeisoli]
MERIRRFIRELSECQWLEVQELQEWEITRSYYKAPGEYEDAAPYPEGQQLQPFPSKQGTTYFFRKKLDIPASWMNAPFGLVFESGGEGLLRVNGRSFQGLDRNHTYVTLDPSKVGSTPVLEIELFDPVPEPVDPLNRQAVIQPPITSVTSLMVRPNHQVRSLMYTVTVIRDTALLLSGEDFRRTRLIEALYRAMDQFMNLETKEIHEGEFIASIEETLVRGVKEVGGNAEGLEHMVGQSHIDIAWLWPVRETVRKTSRTFSTVDRLMDEYPEYRYAQSQPLLFAFLKQQDPELYERVKARVAEGRWELVGGMWVEPDLNIPSGESLIRQMLYGQRFYREEFGRTSRIEWLPDTFGYCASLPQILKHGGVEYFMTTKLGWNDTNVFPHDLFHWVGIDGTSMLSYLNHGVNEHTLPKDIHDHWQSYRQKAAHPEQMLLYGHGDGGGGVTREMLEYIDRAELMVGQPASRYSTASEFFAGISKAQPKLPEWHGDLYLELHRGTYTTHARNKRKNRKAEVLYREAELWNSLALAAVDKAKDKAMDKAMDRTMDKAMDKAAQAEIRSALHEGWKLILLNQFHDIIPGSAITEAYVTSEKEYTQIFDYGISSLRHGLEIVADQVRTDGYGEGTPYIVFNSLGWCRSAVIRIRTEAAEYEQAFSVFDSEGRKLPIEREADGVTVLVPEIPALGYTTIWLKSCSEEVLGSGSSTEWNNTWETAFYRVNFNDRGEITSLYDKAAGRELVKKGERANQFHFFHDRPTLWDAWDLDDRYEEQVAGEAQLLEPPTVHAGTVRDVLRFRWRIHQSEIRQDMIFYHNDRRIDFSTEVSWNEAHKLLKVGFPVDVVTDKATYEIPFGTLERPTHRNTSWEQAQYEVCGHRFADVSEHGYGVSLLNDCKYGYDIQGSTIRLSLLRAPKWPDVEADLGEHEFTYSLYPHEGDWRTAHTLRRAAELNHDVSVQQTSRHAGNLPVSGSLIELESRHVILDTVKPAEDGQGTILRFYESSGGRETVKLNWPYAFKTVYLSNALEDPGDVLEVNESQIELSFSPYEIVTILIQ